MAERGEFDVIVVGGGAAGCVVAARLSESGSRSILLLEAGPDLRADLPDEIRDGWHMTRQFDWGYASDPDELGIVQDLRRVKLLGGTSSITRFALRGSPADYNEWEALGNPGWGFAEVLPHLKRLETDLDFGDQPWHGDSGPIPITRFSESLGFAFSGTWFSTNEEADRIGFRGSPTILVYGVDPFATGDEIIGFACRIYTTPAGPAGFPTDAQLRRAVSQ